MTFSGADARRAWIPNVTGYLSFSMLGRTTFPTPCKRANVVADGERFVIAYQKRFLSDTTAPFLSDYAPIWFREWIDVVVLRKDRSSRYVVIAHHRARRDVSSTDADDLKQQSAESDVSLHAADLLTGDVFIVGREEWKQNGIGGLSLEGRVRVCQTELENSATSQERGQILDEAKEALALNAAAHCRVCVERSGAITIKPRLPMKDGGATHSDASNDDATRDIVRQVYYFMKDMLHLHYHHAESTDSLIAEYPQDDPLWARGVFNSLMRKVLELRRQGTRASLSRALGFLTYARTFNHLYLATDSYTDAVRFEELQRSLEASDALAQALSDGRGFGRGWAVNFFATLMALVIAYASLLQVPLKGAASGYIDTTSVDPGLVSIAQLALYNPWSFVALFVVTVVAAWLSFLVWDAFRGPRAHGAFDIADVRWIRTATRLLPAIARQKLAGAMIMLVGMMIFGLACWVIVTSVG